MNFEQRQANQRPFLEKQLELCFAATETTARLASETCPAKWEQARLDFWRLYWGSLCIVEDQSVEAAMKAFEPLVPFERPASPNLPMGSLRMPSLRLAHAARNLVLASWKIDMPALQERRVPAEEKK